MLRYNLSVYTGVSDMQLTLYVDYDDDDDQEMEMRGYMRDELLYSN